MISELALDMDLNEGRVGFQPHVRRHKNSESARVRLLDLRQHLINVVLQMWAYLSVAVVLKPRSQCPEHFFHESIALRQK